MPDLFTPPLLKIGNGCPRLFRQSLGILDMLCEALWDLTPTPLQFQLTPPFAPATCAFFGFMCHAPPATGPLHKLFSLAGVPITLPLELANSYSPFSYHFRVTSTQKLSQSLNQIPHFLNTHIFFFFHNSFQQIGILFICGITLINVWVPLDCMLHEGRKNVFSPTLSIVLCNSGC